MGERVEKAFEKLVPLVPHGQTLQAAASTENYWGQDTGGAARGLEAYWTAQGREAWDDVFRDVPYGFLGITEERLLVAKQKLFGSLTPKQLVLEAELEECGVVWYDRTMGKMRGAHRFLHLTFPEDRFGTARVHMLGSTAGGYRDVVIAAADAVVAQFGERATHVADPPDEWP